MTAEGGCRRDAVGGDSCDTGAADDADRPPVAAAESSGERECGDLRVVDAVIAGAQKAGTSSLLRYLGQHPQIGTHSERELTYFVVDREYRSPYREIYDHYFPASVRGCDILLAKSAGIMFVPEALERLRRHNPHCKLIVILRNPVDRAYSAFWYMRRKGRETATTFEEALEKQGRRGGGTGWRKSQLAYVARGEYADQLERLTEAFGRERWQAVLLDDLRQDSTQVCQDLFRHLGVDPTFEPRTERHHNPSKAPRSQFLSRLLVADNPVRRALGRVLPRSWKRAIRGLVEKVNETPFESPPMKLETRKSLVEHFRPHNERLEQILGRDLSAWNRAGRADGRPGGRR